MKLQLDSYKLYIQGYGVSEIADKLNRRVSTVQRALKLVDEFVGLPVQPTFEEHVLYYCQECKPGQWCEVGKRLYYQGDYEPHKATNNVEGCAGYPSYYPYQCPGCAGMIDSLDHAKQQHTECADKLRAEAA